MSRNGDREAHAALEYDDVFRVDVSAEADEVVMRLRGEADLATAEHLQTAVAGIFASNAVFRRLVLDLEELRFIDACCIGIIANAEASLRQMGRDLVVRSPAPIASRVLGICGMNGLIEP